MTPASNPLVSVIVPVYNVERYVDECLDSIRAQTHARLEIVVVEDCSTDGSLAKLQPHLADPRVRLIRHEKNGGLSAARNTGIEAATGEYVMFVDSDDAIAHTLVDACLTQAQASGADVVVFDFAAFQDGEALPRLGSPAGDATARQLDRVDYLKLPHFAWLKFIRAELLRDPRLRFPVGFYYEDWPFHWELGFSAASILMLDGAWLGYRQRGTSITASLGAKLLDQFRVQQAVLDTVRERGAEAEATVLFSKAHGTFWAVLSRIDASLLPKAITAAKALRRALKSLDPKPAAGARAATMALLLSLPDPLTGVGMRALRSAKRSVGERAEAAVGGGTRSAT